MTIDLSFYHTKVVYVQNVILSQTTSFTARHTVISDVVGVRGIDDLCARDARLEVGKALELAVVRLIQTDCLADLLVCQRHRR